MEFNSAFKGLKTTPKKISATSHHILLQCSTAFREINSLQVRQPDGGLIPSGLRGLRKTFLIVLWNDQPPAAVILNDKQFHVYHPQKAQTIGTNNFLHRATGSCVASQRFLSTVMCTDEACFTHNGNLMT
jgi:hypothetical protein